MWQSGDRRVCRTCCDWSKLSDCRYPAFLSFKSKGKRIHVYRYKRSCQAARPNGLAARPEKLVQWSQRRLPCSGFHVSGKHRRQPENMGIFFQRSRSQRSICSVWRLACGSWSPFPVHHAARLILSPRDGAMTSNRAAQGRKPAALSPALMRNATLGGGLRALGSDRAAAGADDRVVPLESAARRRWPSFRW